ncbi:MAG TPA: hypothetical protein DEG17_08445 [Cyanobacteria bacterium UBA11149]|nr:hypothetical protein [Cyanobacteria bacterium UBA11367]HBE59738.1 hypothetical protein [Cyanobacteria bacterium UBA11366]HBK65353.1 hypothetical protein [Cyanobacteria bacterium UBA11166]HBR76568.1 hypothetical protein [Cyanobacteria bacterium UBA11159]HBS68179.1 hypothetical protein [Cyanobacteria bacterium UBA11153]HBW88888.1 hypothetical protein [Cyanobacteria bacterium UBA11149]HCA94579.1 hypothetical protein [Cyanobacteria bacterium UBA9226]
MKNFQLWFDFQENPFDEKGELGLSWGRFGIRIDNQELFIDSQTHQAGLEWNLIYFYEWLTSIFIEDIQPNPILFSDWESGVKYSAKAKKLLEDSETIEEEDQALKRWTWIASKNIWNVGQGIKTPSIFFVINPRENWVEISWNNSENQEKGFDVLLSEIELIDLTNFNSEVNYFTMSYHSKMKQIRKEED